MLDSVTKKSNLFLVRGVFPSDFVKKELTIAPKAEPEPEYSEIPAKFTSVDTWIKKTNLLCWSCGLTPTGSPAFLPSNPELNSNGRPICSPVGNFCDWPCVIRYINTEIPEPQRSDAHKLVCLFEFQFSGKRKEVIKASIPKTEMKIYCGKRGKTEKQYREAIHNNYYLTEFSISSYKEH